MREFDELLSDFFGSPLGRSTIDRRTWYLPLDVVDTGQGYEVKAALPGFKPEDVEITFSDGVLSIRAESKQESETREGTYLRREMRYGNYARSIHLPGDINAKDIKATFDDGMLSIEMPRVTAPEPVKIPVSTKSEKQLIGVKSEK